VDESGGVVRVDHQNAHDGLIASDLLLQFSDIGCPVTIRIHPVCIGRKGGMKHFRQKMRGIRRLRHDNPGIDPYGTVCPGNGIAQAIEEDDVFRRNLHLAHLIDTIRQEFPGFINTLGGTVSIGKVVP
jgi:hypothetical protein